jgi:hypothetical protein
MKKVNGGKTWERTNVTNLLRNGPSGNYYARVKVNGKEKWRTLKTKVFSAAKLKLGDVERDERSKGMVARRLSHCRKAEKRRLSGSSTSAWCGRSTIRL